MVFGTLIQADRRLRQEYGTPSTPLITVYDTVNPTLKHMKLRIFSLRLLGIRRSNLD